MPIEGLSEKFRVPRLGKIRLGIKVEQPGKSPYPRATDYFVCEEPVRKRYGDRPTELDIMFPTEDPEQFAPQWLKAYTTTHGLVCKGDGRKCSRKYDAATGEIAGKDTKDWVWKEDMDCNPDTCVLFRSKRCRGIMNLHVLLPEVEGFGTWQLDTSSTYGILNLNSILKILQPLGRMSFIPMKMFLDQIEVTPAGESKKKVRVINFRIPYVLSEVARMSQLPASRLLWSPDIDESAPDHFPDDVLAAGEMTDGTVVIDEQTQIAWEITQGLLKELEVKDEQVYSWFTSHYNVEVHLEAFREEYPPRPITPEMLSKFVDSLQAYKENML